MNQSHAVSDEEKWVLDYLASRMTMITPSDLSRKVQTKWGLSRKEARSLIQGLVAQGDLEYLDVHGRTCVGLSFSRPVRLSSRVVLKPPEHGYDPDPTDVVISLNKGTSFGRGTHPTTCLSIQALTHVHALRARDGYFVKRALDIGTGTGVLALASAMLGAESVLACDIDPVALDEAEKNVRLNHQQAIVQICESCDDIRDCDLIIANLRYPTLISLCATIRESLTDKAHLILSGIKNEEKHIIVDAYVQGKMRLEWEASQNGWCALVFQAQHPGP